MTGAAPDPRPPFVFFDFGETLVSLRPLLACLGNVLQDEYRALPGPTDALAVSWILSSADRMPRDPAQPFETEHRVASTVLTELLRARGVDVSRDQAGLLLRRAWDRFEERVSMSPDAGKGFLAEVHRVSAGVGLVTDGDSENVQRLLARLGLVGVFDSVTVSEDVRAYKPNPVIYRHALASLRADPARSLFVSDTVLDVQGAVGVGMAAALVHRGPLSEHGNVPHGAIRLQTLRDVLPVLRNFREHGSFRL